MLAGMQASVLTPLATLSPKDCHRTRSLRAPAPLALPRLAAQAPLQRLVSEYMALADAPQPQPQTAGASGGAGAPDERRCGRARMRGGSRVAQAASTAACRLLARSCSRALHPVLIAVQL